MALDTKKAVHRWNYMSYWRRKMRFFIQPGREKKTRHMPIIKSFPKHPDVAAEDGADDTTIKVMTLNTAHGRKNGRHQIFQRTSSIISNLDDIASVFNRETPHVIALQEADGPSAWSGNFCHVEYLAQRSRYAFAIRGEHARGIRLSYGTALLSSLDIADPVSVRFPTKLTTPPKGFVACTVAWPGTSRLNVDVVSVHLDFSRRSIRKCQVEHIVSVMERSKNPIIMMGDFNCEWNSRDPSLRMLAEKLKLDAYRPEADDMMSFPRLGRRLDWILISPHLQFSSYRVFQDAVSDHLGIVTEIGIAKGMAGNRETDGVQDGYNMSWSIDDIPENDSFQGAAAG